MPPCPDGTTGSGEPQAAAKNVSEIPAIQTRALVIAIVFPYGEPQIPLSRCVRRDRLTEFRLKALAIGGDSPERPSERPDDRTWDDLEQGFFASAPPDVPEPPPEPARFDDLVSDEPPRPDRLAAARRALTTAVIATRKSSVRVLSDVRRRADARHGARGAGAERGGAGAEARGARARPGETCSGHAIRRDPSRPECAVVVAPGSTKPGHRIDDRRGRRALRWGHRSARGRPDVRAYAAAPAAPSARRPASAPFSARGASDRARGAADRARGRKPTRARGASDRARERTARRARGAATRGREAPTPPSPPRSPLGTPRALT